MGMKERRDERREASSPRGLARAARENGDALFQLQVPADTASTALNEVAAEGWQLAQMAVEWAPKNTANLGGLMTTSHGTMIGFYVFSRRPSSI